MSSRIFTITTFCAVLLTIPICSGCSSISPHDNFVRALNETIGQNIDNVPSYSWPHENDLSSSVKLKNGNIENRYRYIRSCVLIFEIDSITRKVVKADFEGKITDCVINP